MGKVESLRIRKKAFREKLEQYDGNFIYVRGYTNVVAINVLLRTQIETKTEE